MKKFPGLYFYQTAVDRILFFPPWYAKPFFQEKEKEVGPRNQFRASGFWRISYLMPELRQDEKRLYIYFRMPSDCFNEILSLIKEDITKKGHKLSWNYISRRTTCYNTKVNKQHIFYIKFILLFTQGKILSLCFLFILIIACHSSLCFAMLCNSVSPVS